MNMKPILFNTPMVQAILEGKKTVTRRAVKPQPWGELYKTNEPGLFVDLDIACLFLDSPYKPGDILYVRETFQVDYLSNIIGSGRVKFKDGTYMDIQFAPERYYMMRRAHLKPGWRPNEHMPREAARIFLRVKDVRAEQLKAIDAEQAKAEGMMCVSLGDGTVGYSPGRWDTTTFDGPVGAFAKLWDSTIKKENRRWYGWEANPWVWVIEFERISKEEASEQEE